MSKQLTQRLRTSPLIRKHAIISEGSIQILGLVYRSDDLAEWTDLYGDDLPVMAHLMPDDLSQVGVEHPVDGHMVIVPCTRARDVRRLPILAHLDWLARTSPDTVIRAHDDLADALDDRRRHLID